MRRITLRNLRSRPTLTPWGRCFCTLVLWLGMAPHLGLSQSLPPLLQPLSKLALSSPASSATGATVPHAAIVFNGQTLFQVYGSGDRNAQDRADLANLRLSDALRAMPANGEVSPPAVTVDSGGTDVVLRLDGQPLLTVTRADAVNSGQTTLALAESWTAELRRAFDQTLRERQPAYLHWAIKQTLRLLLLGALTHLLIWIVARRWLGKPGWPVQALLWIVILRLMLDLFPQTRPINTVLWAGVLRPVTLFLVVSLAAAVLARLWGTVLRRLFPPLPEHLSTEERTERTFRRRATLGTVVRVTGVTVIWVIALLVALTWAGVNLSALLASAGLIGVAISLAAQDSMKDLVAGINILTDDRFGVGDNIAVGAYEGKVERLTLRITQIRDMAGRLITIPNRNIVEVANLTARWAQVDFKVGVSYFDDLTQAMTLLEAAAKNLAEERPEQVLADPEMLGVDSFNDQNITLRLTLRTPPGDQWIVARELRVRVKTAFDSASIAFLNSQYAPTTLPHLSGGHGKDAPASPASPAAIGAK